MPKKRAKRPDGDARVTRNVKRNRWEAKLTIGRDEDGRLVRKLYTGRTQKEVADKIDDARKELAAGVDLVTAASTVKEYLDQWLTEVLPGTVSAGTLKNYSEVAKYWIIPQIGDVKLAELTPGHVERMLRALAADGKSTNTQRLARSVLRRALRRAQQQGVLSRNVAQIADGVKVSKKKEGRALSIEQARTLLDHIASSDNRRIKRLETAWLTALSLGLRRGELLGLRWDDLELGGDTPVLRVRYALKRETGRGLVIEAPKTADSAEHSTSLPA
ncbi:MAG: site-specific integrase [Acidimicrobiales bacterium]